MNQKIKKELFKITYEIESFNLSGDTDINRYAETYFLEIINIVFQNKGWRFKKTLKINQSTYDLYDSKNKICIQITSNTRAEKKRNTIKSFKNKFTQEEFNHLIILFLSSKKKPSIDSTFDDLDYTDYNIIEFASLIESECDMNQLQQIYNILYTAKEATFTTRKENSKSNIVSLKIAEKEFLRIKQLENRLKKDLISPNCTNIYDRETLGKHPYMKFWSSRFVLQSIEDETFPYTKDDSEWQRTFLYDFDTNGLLIWLSGGFEILALINDEDEWILKEDIGYANPIPTGFKEVDVRIIGVLPYKFITYFEKEDDIYGEPHIYCKYEGIDDSPFIDFVYLYPNFLGFYSIELYPEKRINNLDSFIHSAH